MIGRVGGWVVGWMVGRVVGWMVSRSGVRSGGGLGGDLDCRSGRGLGGRVVGRSPGRLVSFFRHSTPIALPVPLIMPHYLYQIFPILSPPLASPRYLQTL